MSNAIKYVHVTPTMPVYGSTPERDLVQGCELVDFDKVSVPARTERVAVIIAARVDHCPHRRAALDHVKLALARSGLDMDLRIVDADPSKPFSICSSLNAGVASTDAEIIVLQSADSLVRIDSLRASIELARRSPGIVYPWCFVYYTTPAEASQLYRAEPFTFHVARDRCGAGGTRVMSRATYELAGGHDERLWADGDWGGEDVQFLAAATTLVVPARRARWGSSPMIHLWHPRQTTRGEWSALTTRYMRALGNRDAMTALVRGGKLAARENSSQPNR